MSELLTVPFTTKRVLARVIADVRPDTALVRLVYSEKEPHAAADVPFIVRGAMEFPTSILADALGVLESIRKQLIAAPTVPAPPPPPAPALDGEVAWAANLPESDAALLQSLGLPSTDLPSRAKRRRPR